MVLELILLATIGISLVSLVGVLFISPKKRLGDKLLMSLVSLAAGTLLGAAFLDLMPEALELSASSSVLHFSLFGILVFFVLEKLIVWHHHHSAKHDKKVNEKPAGYLNLVGDALHNFFDGVAISAAFLVSPAIGLTTTFAVALHEIPQEIGDFSLLIYSGFSRQKAILFNVGSAAAAIVGALFFYFSAPLIENLEAVGLAFTAGMFIYIASADVVPELHKEKGPLNSIFQFACIIIGVALIWVLTTFVVE